MLLLCDLSEWQERVDFGALKRYGVAGVYLRATYGAGGFDKQVRQHLAGARAARLRVGFYHYAYPSHHPSGDAEARWFCSSVRSLGGIDRRDLRPLLDVEESPPRPTYVAWSRDWNRTVKRELGVLPLFYSYGPYIAGMRASTPIGAGLVLAGYGRNDGAEHPIATPPPWRSFVAHQFTSNGRIPGISQHLDLWHATNLRPLLCKPLSGLV